MADVGSVMVMSTLDTWWFTGPGASAAAATRATTASSSAAMASRPSNVPAVVAEVEHPGRR